jgi:hypothetical protein
MNEEYADQGGNIDEMNGHPILMLSEKDNQYQNPNPTPNPTPFVMKSPRFNFFSLENSNPNDMDTNQNSNPPSSSARSPRSKFFNWETVSPRAKKSTKEYPDPDDDGNPAQDSNIISKLANSTSPRQTKSPRGRFLQWNSRKDYDDNANNKIVNNESNQADLAYQQYEDDAFVS